eukprot:3091048-Pleurochrysis_carterae.AAC.1
MSTTTRADGEGPKAPSLLEFAVAPGRTNIIFITLRTIMSNGLNGVRQEHFKARASKKELASHRRHGGHGDAPTARAAS